MFFRIRRRNAWLVWGTIPAGAAQPGPIVSSDAEINAVGEGHLADLCPAVAVQQDRGAFAGLLLQVESDRGSHQPAISAGRLNRSFDDDALVEVESAVQDGNRGRHVRPENGVPLGLGLDIEAVGRHAAGTVTDWPRPDTPSCTCSDRRSRALL